MRLPVLMALAAMTGCKVTEENWPEKIAKAECAYRERCAAADFWYYYESGRDCEDEYIDRWDEFGSKIYSECDFNEEKAKDCLDAMDSSCKDVGEQYDDWDETCYEVWECSTPTGE